MISIKKWTILFLFMWNLGLQAQNNSLERKFVPIIWTDTDALLQSQIEAWTAFKYMSDGEQWQAVPFQVDERDAEGKYNKENDGEIDENDELVIMPDDLGDRAPAHVWLDDTNSKNFARIELQFTDPIDGKTGWIYLYQGVLNTPAVMGYLDYSPPLNGTASDTAKSLIYNVGNNSTGWLDYISISPELFTDLVDQLKVRLSGQSQFPGIGSYVITEELLKAKDDPSTFHKGLVRSFHDKRAILSLPFWPTPVDADYQLQFFPYSFRMSLTFKELDATLAAIIGLKNLRVSLDLNNESSTTRQFFSDKNRAGLTIDGVPDNADLSIDQDAEFVWVMATGQTGTILMILNTLNIANSTKQLYYLDDEQSRTPDGTQDTGDGQSFGDMGMRIFGDVLAANSLRIDAVVYMLDEPQLDADFGARLFSRNQNVIAVQSTVQQFDPTSVSSLESVPVSFVLLPTSPNPYTPGQGTVTIQMQTEPMEGPLQLVIYNSLGQEIISFEDFTHATQRIDWNGRDYSGKFVRSGIYFLHLRGRTKTMTQKMIILP